MSTLKSKTILTLSDFRQAARLLRLSEVAPVRAAAEVESRGRGFLDDGRAVILFEAHKFSAHTKRRFDNSHPHISSRNWNRRLYRGGKGEYARLELAKTLDESAALKSASWGAFQILGENFALCGFASVQAFVAAMQTDMRAHLLAFCRYVLNRRLDDELRGHKWAAFARAYNGPNYAVNKYDKKLAKAYAKFKKLESAEVTPPPLPDEAIAQQIAAQRWYLNEAELAAQVAKEQQIEIAKTATKYTAPAAAVGVAVTWGEWLVLHWWGVSMTLLLCVGVVCLVGLWWESRKERYG